MADEEALRKIRSVEEQIDILNKKLSIAKQVCTTCSFRSVAQTMWPVWSFVFLRRRPLLPLQEEDALLSEMDVTGQAFEDMQEQNIRLMQQLREKDDANFKLMSERIKSNQIHKLLKEEKEELADQLLTLKTQVSLEGSPQGATSISGDMYTPVFSCKYCVVPVILYNPLVHHSL